MARITADKLGQLTERVGREIDRLPDGKVLPFFRDAFLSRGATYGVCADTQAKEWLTRIVPDFRSWEGTGLQLCRLTPLQSYNELHMDS